MFSNSYAPINNYFNISFFIFFLLVALCIVCQIAAKGRLPITFSLVFAKTSNLPNIVLRVFYFLIFLCTLISMYLAFLSASADDKADPYSMTLVLFLVFFLSLTRILFGKNREQFQEIQTDSDPRHIETTANPLNDEKQKEEQSSSDTTRDFTDENSNSDQTTSKTSVSSFKTDCDLENNFSASSNIKKTNSVKSLLTSTLESIKTFASKKPILFVFAIIIIFLLCMIPLFMVEDICNDPFGSGFGSSKMTRRFKESSCKPGKPCHVYLTVSEDLRTSTVVIFHTAKPYNTKPSCKYGELSGDGYPNEVQGETYEIKFDSKRYIHYVGINQLTPNTDYKFICGESGETDDWSDEKQFRTSYNSLSDGKITFAVGADTNVIKETNQITEMMANNNPNFAAIAGDLALTNGNVHCYRKWDKWLSNWGKYAKSNNNLIPILPTIGNHETQTGYRKTEKPDTTIAPFFMTLFQHNSKIKKDPFTQKTYQVSRITDVIAFISLDTNHVYSEVEQEDWVEENLVKLRNEGVKYIFPIYHVPAFPSDRKFSVQQSLAIRESWVKLFDKHDITLAFEGHSHMLKVTKPIRDGLVVEQTQGTRYLGDGAWGRLRDRRDTTVTRWYEDHVDSIRHVWMVDVDEDNLTASAKNDKNEIQASIHY